MSQQVLIADDNEQVRTWLRVLLESEGFTVSEACDGPAAVEAARAIRPGFALLDLAMPGFDGIAAGSAIRQCCPATRLVLVTAHSQAGHIVRALRAGFLGYVVKSDAPDGLLRALREVRAARLFLSPSASRAVIDAYPTELIPSVAR